MSIDTVRAETSRSAAGDGAQMPSAVTNGDAPKVTDDDQNARGPSRVDGEGRKGPRPPWIVLLACLFVATGILVTYGLVVKSGRLVLVLLLIATASLLVGGILGFLFGIPRTVKQNSMQEPSTSLEQVADWLTKILVGAGLVELTKVGGALDRFGKTVAPPPADASAAVVSEASAVLFAILGFGASYLWTRTEYVGIQARADREVFDVFEQLKDIRKTVASAASTAEAARETAGEGRKAADRAQELAELNRDILRGDVKAGPSIEALSISPAPTQRVFEGFPPDLFERIEKFREWPANDYDSDPNADLFAQVPRERDGRRLDASIRKEYPNALRIEIGVTPLPGAAPLTAPVVFLLHPTFRDNRIIVVQPAKDVAKDEMLSEGVFTVVAICDEGKTVLAFPLSKLPGAPQWFLEA